MRLRISLFSLRLHDPFRLHLIVHVRVHARFRLQSRLRVRCSLLGSVLYKVRRKEEYLHASPGGSADLLYVFHFIAIVLIRLLFWV